MRKYCPLGRMSCIGRYPRNVVTLKQTMAWVLLWCCSGQVKLGFLFPDQQVFGDQVNIRILWWCSGIADICLQEIFIRYREQWSSETLFWIWNVKGFAVNEGLHILIPFALSVPTDARSKNSSSIGFYVHKPSVLVPRRPMRHNSKLVFVQEYAGEPSQLSKVKICPKRSNRDNVLPKQIPLIETQQEEIIMSIPNLQNVNTFPSILYCKAHQSYRIVTEDSTSRLK